ncbi:sensor histidine kinase [Aquimarina sp. AU474]|uniref:sensor histidine kinase n=1 Tax=Aquimarina sp. AU474 TaxID=2108529 RepID=UPI000D69171B|nr:ATP-binding protein [Aquimarina sp. AU474]
MEDWKNPLTPIWWIAGTLLLFSVLLLFIIVLTKKYVNRIKKEEQQKATLQIRHNEKLLNNSIEIQEKERTRIAADIHDELIGQLRRIQLMNDDESLSDPIKNSIGTARRISHDLTPPLLQESLLGDLFQTILSPMNSLFIIDFYVSENSKIIIPEKTKINIYRIFQEVITNIDKHANASQIFIKLRVSNRFVFLSVKDNGIGLPSHKNKGLGMKNISLRTKQLNAQFKFAPNIPQGTKFTLLYKQNEYN